MSSKSKSCLIASQNFGNITKYAGANTNLTGFDDIEIIEYFGNGRVVVELHYFGSSALSAGVLANYNGFPIGTKITSHFDGSIVSKNSATSWGKVTQPVIS